MTYANGDRFVGRWAAGAPVAGRLSLATAQPALELAPGEVYVGDVEVAPRKGSPVAGAGWVVAGRPCGAGTMTYANGDIYEGRWRSGMRLAGPGEYGGTRNT